MAKHSFIIVLCIGVIAIILACLFRCGILSVPNTVNIDTSSTLSEAIDIAELSTSEFRYNGIADVYADAERTKVRCRVCYYAIVKAGIDMKKVTFDVDSTNMTVNVTLPDIDIKVTIIDEKSIRTLPSDAKVGIDERLRISKEDAEREARESSELMIAARENLESTIEGLLYPILKPQGYSLTWK